MTRNQKIAIGIGALALGYWLYTKNKEGKSVKTQLSQETIDCLRSKMLVANGKITEEQFNNLVANNFSESSVRSLVETLSKVANPNADIKGLTNSATSEIYSLLKNCKDSKRSLPSTQPTTSNPCKYPNEVPCANGSGKCYMINARYKSDPCKVEDKGQVHGRSDGTPCDVVVKGMGIIPNGGRMQNGVCVPHRAGQKDKYGMTHITY